MDSASTTTSPSPEPPRRTRSAIATRRLLAAGLVFLALTAGVVTYVAIYDWPAVAVDGWDWLQGLAGWVPDLPGM